MSAADTLAAMSDQDDLTRLLKAKLNELAGEYRAIYQQVADDVRKLKQLHAAHTATLTLIRLTEPDYQPSLTYGVGRLLDVRPLIERPTAGATPGQDGAAVERTHGSETLGGVRFRDASPEQIALALTQESEGKIAVQAVASALFRTGRYKSESSAYGAAHSQLSRNPRFEKAGRGAFRLRDEGRAASRDDDANGGETNAGAASEMRS